MPREPICGQIERQKIFFPRLSGGMINIVISEIIHPGFAGSTEFFVVLRQSRR
jgi:hypothetical protein